MIEDWHAALAHLSDTPGPTAIARHLGVHVRTVRFWAQGTREPSAAHKREMVRLAGLTVSQLAEEGLLRRRPGRKPSGTETAIAAAQRRWPQMDWTGGAGRADASIDTLAVQLWRAADGWSMSLRDERGVLWEGDSADSPEEAASELLAWSARAGRVADVAARLAQPGVES